MLLAALSDIHDNIWKLETACALIRQREAGRVLFCGDFCAPFTLKQLAESIGGVPLDIVWGNNDGDKWLLTTLAAAQPHVTLHGEFAEIKLSDGFRIAMNHYPAIARPIAAGGSHELVCYGHDHRRHHEILPNGVHLLNPGEIMARFGQSTFALHDTATRETEFVDVEA